MAIPAIWITLGDDLHRSGAGIIFRPDGTTSACSGYNRKEMIDKLGVHNHELLMKTARQDANDFDNEGWYKGPDNE